VAKDSTTNVRFHRSVLHSTINRQRSKSNQKSINNDGGGHQNDFQTAADSEASITALASLVTQPTSFEDDAFLTRHMAASEL